MTNQAYEGGIRKGIWIPTQFNEYRTPVVPIRKSTYNRTKEGQGLCLRGLFGQCKPPAGDTLTPHTITT